MNRSEHLNKKQAMRCSVLSFYPSPYHSSGMSYSFVSPSRASFGRASPFSVSMSTSSAMLVPLCLLCLVLVQAAPTSANSASATATDGTSIQTTTQFTGAVGPFGANYITSIMTITAISSLWSSSLTLPTTITQTVISDIHVDLSYTDISSTTHKDTSSYTSTAHSTWVIHQPQPSVSYLPVDPANYFPLNCDRTNWKADPICESESLHTACEAQCDLRKTAVHGNEEDLYWCQMMTPPNWYWDVKPGRVCWGGINTFRQVNTPCLVADYPVNYLTCSSIDMDWGAGGLDWEGPKGGV